MLFTSVSFATSGYSSPLFTEAEAFLRIYSSATCALNASTVVPGVATISLTSTVNCACSIITLTEASAFLQRSATSSNEINRR